MLALAIPPAINPKLWAPFTVSAIAMTPRSTSSVHTILAIDPTPEVPHPYLDEPA